MIIQNDISFDTFYGRVIDPIVEKPLSVIVDIIKKKKIEENFYINLLDNCVKYVEKLSPSNMNDYIQNLYFIMCYLMHKIIDTNRDVKHILNPQTFQDYIILKRYMTPLIELFEETHPKAEEFNTFAHNYLLDSKLDAKVQAISIIENITSPKMKIHKILVEDFENYLKENQLIFTLTGCLFYKHERKKSLFVEFLTRMKEMRNEYKRLRDTNTKGSPQYVFYDMLQNATKVTMNSTYGLYGMNLFRYSNKWLAKTITVSGRLTLKIAQKIGELLLNSNYGGK